MRMFGCLALAGLVVALSQPTQAADEDQWITIKGQIVLADGEQVVTRGVITPTQDKDHCLSKGQLLEEKFLVNGKSRGIANVVVWLGPDTDKKGAPFPKESIHPKLAKPSVETVEIDQPCCMFTPHMLVAREGQKLLIKNSSPVPHNANWTSKANGNGNIALPPGGKHEVGELKADRLPMEVRCNVHPWMNAWVRVYDHPYFAITDENGNFEIKLAPTGKFRMFYWHEVIGFKDGAKGRTGEVIELKPGKSVDLGKISMKEAKE